MDDKILIRKRILYAAVIIAIIALYFFSETARSKITEIFLVFTSSSVESISGYLRNAGFSRISTSILLSIFQMLVFPFRYREMIFAHSRVYPSMAGFILCYIGRMAGTLLCFDIAQTFLSGIVKRFTGKVSLFFKEEQWERKMSFAIKILPINDSFGAFLAGGLGLQFKNYGIISGIWTAVVTWVYFIKNGYFSYGFERLLFYSRIILFAAIVLMIYRKYKKK